LDEPKRKRALTVFVWAALVVVFVLAFSMSGEDKPAYSQAFDAFLNDVRLGRVAEVRVRDNQLTVTLRGTGEKYSTFGVLDDALVAQLSEHRARVIRGENERSWGSTLSFLVPLVLIAVLGFYLLRRASGQGVGNVLALTKTRAREIAETGKATFADVGGCDEAKQSLGDVIDFLKNPLRWSQAGVRLPRGVLLEGPPGCGKTLLARAVAGETKANFYLTSASEFVEMFIGVGAARVRDTFEMARKHAPAVIFIDELDAVGRRRGSGIGASHDEREQTLNQLLVCLDGFDSRDAVVVIAATNRPDILDPALLRPGRFDRRVRIPVLSVDARLQTLRIHTRNKNLSTGVSLELLAERTEGFNGAQLESLANEAAVLAVRRAAAMDGQRPEVRMEDFLEVLRSLASQVRTFNRLDAILIESTSQLAQPTGKAVVRLALAGDSTIEGQLLWADANYVKICGACGETIVPKAQIRRIEALEGTEMADPLDVQPDPWARRNPGTA